MQADELPDADFVRRATAALVERRPDYRALLQFHGDVFAAGEDARPRVRIPAGTIDPAAVRAALAGRSSLIRPAEMRFDPHVTAALFGELCRIAVAGSLGLAEPARALSNRPEAATALAVPFLCEDEDRLFGAAARWGVAAPALTFFLYHSLRPSLSRCAQELSGFLAEGMAERGTCPICGSLPALGWLSAERERFLHCSFCWHRWPLRRLVCPFCDQSNRLSYIYTDEEPEYRLEVCDGCRKYLKTVDSRNLPRPAYPPLEQVASLHLDFKAAESGYEPALPIDRPMPSDPD